MKTWNTNYRGNEIRVENSTFSERLYINGKLHDEAGGGGSRSKLIGRLTDGKLVKVSLGGIFRIRCTIFVEDELVMDYEP